LNAPRTGRTSGSVRRSLRLSGAGNSAGTDRIPACSAPTRLWRLARTSSPPKRSHRPRDLHFRLVGAAGLEPATSRPCKAKSGGCNTAGRRANSIPRPAQTRPRCFWLIVVERWFARFHGLTRPVDGLPSVKGEETACLVGTARRRGRRILGASSGQNIVPRRASTPAAQRCFGAGPYAATVTRRSWGCVVSSGTGSPDATRSSM
jgi:hypothetical protein